MSEFHLSFVEICDQHVDKIQFLSSRSPLRAFESTNMPKFLLPLGSRGSRNAIDDILKFSRVYFGKEESDDEQIFDNRITDANAYIDYYNAYLSHYNSKYPGSSDIKQIGTSTLEPQNRRFCEPYQFAPRTVWSKTPNIPKTKSGNGPLVELKADTKTPDISEGTYSENDFESEYY